MARFRSNVRHVQPLSPVSAGNTSSATRDLERRTNQLAEAIEAIVSKTALVADRQAIETSVRDASAVYWDAETQLFDLAKAAVEVDEGTGSYVPSASADSVGIAINKDDSVTADIVFAGVIDLTPEQLENLIVDEVILPGRYYLSATSPGKLTRQKPAVSVAVGWLFGPVDDCSTSQRLFVLPQMRNFAEDHLHFQVDLFALPAGSHVPPETGEPHEITDPDVDAPGWLPADHESFNGHAPSGAQFGYNLNAHPALRQIWPPFPVSAAVLEFYPADTDTFPLAGRVLPEFCVMDEYGIWWMTACNGQVPWPAQLDTTVSEGSTDSSDSTDSTGAEDCPNTADIRLILSFLKMTFLAGVTTVTSLRTVAGQPIEITDVHGNVRHSGDLVIRLLLTDLIDATDADGSLVLKSVTDNSLKFQAGRVTEGVISDSAEIEVSGSHQRLLDPEDESSATVHQGIVRLSFNSDPAARELSPQLIKLGDAIEREYEGVLYVAFPPARSSRLQLPFYIPTTGIPASPTLTLKAQMFSRAVGPWCEMTASIQRLAAPAPNDPTVVPGTEESVTFDVVSPSSDYNGDGDPLPANRMMTVTSETFEVAAGDTVMVKLARAADATPEFAGEIGLIRITAILAAATE